MDPAACPAPAPPLLEALRPGRVAVLRALQLGDMLCAVPALRALRAALPQAAISLIGLPWAAGFAARFPAYLDDFLAFPGHPELPEQPADAAALPAFLAEARRRRFDLVIQLHGDGRVSNAIAAELGAGIVAGFCPTAARPAVGFLPYPGQGPEIRRLLALTSALGAAPRGEHLEFPLLPADRAELAVHPVTAGLAALEGDYVCLHPGARDPARRWPAAGFAAVGDALYRDYGLIPVITGNGEETALAAALRQAMHAPAVCAAAPISVGALAAVLAGARLVVCNDTGVSHLAAALGLPSVIVFRASQVSRWAPLDGRRHRPVWAPAGAEPGVVTAAVLQQARALLAARPAAGSATARPPAAATAPAPGR